MAARSTTTNGFDAHYHVIDDANNRTWTPPVDGLVGRNGRARPHYHVVRGRPNLHGGWETGPACGGNGDELPADEQHTHQWTP